MPSRRHVLALLASAPALASGCVGERLPDPIAAWRAPGAGETDPRRHALAHAILAPNPHNMQPWLVELVGDDEIVFRPDLERLLPATDPLNRQIVLGCGAFLELFDLAARANNRRAEISLWPEGEPEANLDARPIAHIKLFAEQTQKDALFDSIQARRTNRRPFESRAVPEADLRAASDAAALPWSLPNIGGTADRSPIQVPPAPLRFSWALAGEQLDALRALAWNGFEREAETPAAFQESVNVMRIGRAEIARHRDGLALEGPMIEFARMFGLVNRQTLGDIHNSATRQGIDAWRPLAEDAPAYAWLTTLQNTRAAQIMAGRAYARFNLAATARGLSMHPWSQTLQEYPEMADLFTEMERITASQDGETVQMLVRVGYGPEISPAPRRGLDEHLRT